MASPSSPKGQFRRLAAPVRRAFVCEIDGQPVEALEGDTVMNVILSHQRHLRSFEFGPEKRAGFCLIGACQDCWVRRDDGSSLRACSTLAAPGMKLVTTDGD
jgi:D-hydroxyproline dehydrogenase subunit gamma